MFTKCYDVPFTGKIADLIKSNADLNTVNRRGRMGLTNKTVSKLFGLAAGRCSICKEPVVKKQVKVGEMAHIIAKSKEGARGTLPLAGSIDGYENLILLCPTHHTEIDNDEASFPPEKLHRIKNEHEYYVDQVFKHQTQARSMDIGALAGLIKYLPFTQIIGLLNGLPTSFNMKLFYVEETCENFCYDFPHCRPFFDPHLESHFAKFFYDIRYLNNYIRATCFNGRELYDTSDNIYSNNLYMSRDLSYDQRQEVENYVQQLVNNFSATYYDFLQYIKYNYPEIHLASFVGW